MSEAEKWQSMVDVIIPHPTRPQMLVRQEADQWRLPWMQFAQTWLEPLGAVNREMQRLFGIETTVLRSVAEHWDETDHLVYRTYLLENYSAAGAHPTDLRWIGAPELNELTFAYPKQQAALEAYLGEGETATTPVLRAPWARPGWQRAAKTWICDQLAQLGAPVTGPIEQIKQWSLSCILRAPTTRGQVYFKMTNASGLMVNEATVTQALAQMFPHFMPQPLRIDPGREWMLLADFGKEIGWEAPLDLRAAALCDFARLQIASATKIDELLAIGCIDRRLAKLAEQIDLLLHDAEIMAYVEPDKQQQLLSAAPRLTALCRQLDQYHVPATLVHGDMHMSNVARRSNADFGSETGVASEIEQYIFFDWTDACLAHPFLDMIDILHERDVTIQTQLRDSYLAMWTAYESPERLLEMWQIAAPLCALHQAVSYRAIMANTEAACQHEIAGSVPFWFGKLLDALELASLDEVPID